MKLIILTLAVGFHLLFVHGRTLVADDASSFEESGGEDSAEPEARGRHIQSWSVENGNFTQTDELCALEEDTLRVRQIPVQLDSDSLPLDCLRLCQDTEDCVYVDIFAISEQHWNAVCEPTATCPSVTSPTPRLAKATSRVNSPG